MALQAHLPTQAGQGLAGALGVISHQGGGFSVLRAQYAETTTLGTDYPERAREALACLGWQVSLERHPDGADTLKVAANGAPDVAMIVQQLVQAGSKIYHASLEQPTLEDIFLKMTTENGPSGGQK